jgi:hypothetical protein
LIQKYSLEHLLAALAITRIVKWVTAEIIGRKLNRGA